MEVIRADKGMRLSEFALFMQTCNSRHALYQLTIVTKPYTTMYSVVFHDLEGRKGRIAILDSGDELLGAWDTARVLSRCLKGMYMAGRGEILGNAFSVGRGSVLLRIERGLVVGMYYHDFELWP